MKICIIGDGLVGLTLANMLLRKGLTVDILSSKKKKSTYDESRTLGISKSNVEYFNKEIADIESILWPINNIKIYTEKNTKNELIKFNNDEKKIFSIVKNNHLQKLLKNKLNKNKLFKFKSMKKYNNLVKQKYKLIFICDVKNEIAKKFFFNKIKKSYNSIAYTTLITHKELKKNNTAFQNFTYKGPIAFLPVSKTQTSVVYSFKSKDKKDDSFIKDLIKKYNPSYVITKINKCNYFELKSYNLRNYFVDNFLAFGDLLHQIHPLAGQGFNMSLRDIKLLSILIDKRINLGLEIDSSVCKDFQKNSRDKNYLFSTGIDWIYELFNLESKMKSNLLSNSINIFGKNKIMNSLLRKFADRGLRM